MAYQGRYVPRWEQHPGTKRECPRPLLSDTDRGCNFGNRNALLADAFGLMPS